MLEIQIYISTKNKNTKITTAEKKYQKASKSDQKNAIIKKKTVLLH
jgi:hypothetical protein